MLDYGFQVMTSTGQLSSGNISTFGILKVLQCSTETGSVYVPEFDSEIGFYHPIIDDSVFEQAFTWDNSSKVFTWQRRPDFASRVHSSDFLVYFFRGEM